MFYFYCVFTCNPAPQRGICMFSMHFYVNPASLKPCVGIFTLNTLPCRPFVYTVTYNAAISAAETGKQRQQPLVLYESVQGEREQRNTITYSAAISAVEKGRQMQQPLTLFESTPGERVQRNTITYNAAIGAVEASRQRQRPLVLVRKARSGSSRTAVH